VRRALAASLVLDSLAVAFESGPAMHPTSSDAERTNEAARGWKMVFMSSPKTAHTQSKRDGRWDRSVVASRRTPSSDDGMMLCGRLDVDTVTS
jgi:hypothetical protein